MPFFSVLSCEDFFQQHTTLIMTVETSDYIINLLLVNCLSTLYFCLIMLLQVGDFSL